MPSLPPPPDAVCEQARLSRDARFDGLFFTAVRSTGIYCRPVCPAPPPKPRNVRYYASAAAAEADGYRPCLRCRPELSPAAGPWRRGEAVLGRALRLIDQGALEGAGVPALAERLHVGERQLRRLFTRSLGVSPLQVEGTRRLLFAKQLLTETALPVTEVALAAGFASLRRFNAAFLQAYGLAPSRLRRAEDSAGEASAGGPLVLRLNYRPPYDFAATLAFLRGRALDGLEQVDASRYAREIDVGSGAWLQVSAATAVSDALRLELHGVPASALREVVQRVRRMFDLDAEPAAIASVLGRDARLAPLLQTRPGLRLPSGWDGFEIAVRAVIGQQISVAGARTLTQRLLQRCGQPLPEPLRAQGFSHRFPRPAELAAADLEGLGLTGARQRTLRALAQAVVEGRLDFDPSQPLEPFIERCVALPGIGPWTAHYLALRALGHPDAFPSGDLVLQKALPNDGGRLSAAALASRADAWRPWRSYAVIHLWQAAAHGD
ncbi:DNA-3-methyladenine glycosylase 2 family protein [Aquimonas voraii]|uniref:DNA-3-methyladenine glycosylase II n=1 Tax=Aquimonas voraii TaxID=265719 RepID=A0A1G6VK52_9GAMM|nr:DNA-3-methyladenine glycosylase 2 [Aquimonas voraii]SDD53773.1 DNA-3-methyladenine glycosylase II [Aquimonas voraii]